MILMDAQVWEPLATEIVAMEIEGISNQQRSHKILGEALRKCSKYSNIRMFLE